MNQKRRLRLSHNRVLTGVCGGVAEWYNADPLFVRLMFLLATAGSAFVPGIVIYLCLWYFMPPPAPESDGQAGA